MSIGLETAKVITAAVRAAGKERGLKPLTVVVLDAGGHVVSAEREDGASNNRFEIAYGKAYGALALGIGTHGLRRFGALAAILRRLLLPLGFHPGVDRLAVFLRQIVAPQPHVDHGDAEVLCLLAHLVANLDHDPGTLD